MQGQRNGAGLFPARFEQGSTSNGADLDQQMFWNNIGNSGLSSPSNFIGSSSDLNGSGWDFMESSSMLGQNDQKAVHEWSPIHAFDGNVPLPESQQHGHSNDRSAGNFANRRLFVRSSGSSQLPQDLNNSASVVEDDDCQILETPPIFNKPRSSRTQPIQFSSGAANPLGMSNGSSSDSRRVSHKRKALDGIVEQPIGSGSGSGSGSTSYIQRSTSSLWHPVPNAANPVGARSHSLNQLEQVNSSLGSSTRQVASRSLTSLANPGSIETSRRNTRPRINGTHQQGSQSSSMFKIESATGNTNLSSRQPSRNSLTIRPPTAAATANTYLGAQPVVVQPSFSLHRNLQTVGNSSSGSTTRNSSSVPVSGERSGVSVNPSNSMGVSRNMPSSGSTTRNSSSVPVSGERSGVSRNMPSSGSTTRNPSSVPVSGERSRASVNPSNSTGVSRNIPDHPMFARLSESRDFLLSAPIFGVANGNVNNPGNVASSSQNGAGANAHAHPAAPSWIPVQSPLQHITRVPDSSRRTLLPVVDAGFIAQNSSQPSLNSGPSLAQGVSLSSGSRRHSRTSLSRPAIFLERHANGAVVGPVSAQGLAASESLQQRYAALEQMRREGSQLQAAMAAALDQAAFLEMMHDRHRDMRLDVDNMSYEQLLALEERMGNVKVGLSEESIMKQLKRKKHTRRNVDKTETEPCCICQEDYNIGEDVGTLDCGHDFHSQCIKQWLMQKNICPICKTTGLTAK